MLLCPPVPPGRALRRGDITPHPISTPAPQNPAQQPGRGSSDLERAVPPPASTLGTGPLCSKPPRSGHPRRGERDPAATSPGGRTRRAGPAGAACRPRAPSQGSPGRAACPGSPAGEGLPRQRGDAGGTHRAGPRCGERRAPEGSRAEQPRRDQTIRRPPEPAWPDPDLLPLSGASERRSGAAFRTRRRQPLSPRLCSPPKGQLQERENIPSPSQASRPVQGGPNTSEGRGDGCSWVLTHAGSR